MFANAAFFTERLEGLVAKLPEYLDSVSLQYDEDFYSLTGNDTRSEPAEVGIDLGGIAQSILAGVVDVLVQMGLSLFIFFVFHNDMLDSKLRRKLQSCP